MLRGIRHHISPRRKSVWSARPGASQYAIVVVIVFWVFPFLLFLNSLFALSGLAGLLVPVSLPWLLIPGSGRRNQTTTYKLTQKIRTAGVSRLCLCKAALRRHYKAALRRHCGSSAAALRRLCSGTAAALREHCGGSATALRLSFTRPPLGTRRAHRRAAEAPPQCCRSAALAPQQCRSNAKRFDLGVVCRRLQVLAVGLQLWTR